MSKDIDFTSYRLSETEQERVADLLSLVPPGRASVLDIGARDGYISEQLGRIIPQVYALDLEKPKISFPSVTPVQGRVTDLDYPDNYFDVVLCAEVLEHIPQEELGRACAEISRVARRDVIIGVPFNQDLRCGRTTCSVCGKTNPPWGHRNSFTTEKLCRLFPKLSAKKISFVGTNDEVTNALAALLMDVAGNPYGTYSQEEPCLNCGEDLQPVTNTSFLQRALCRVAVSLQKFQMRLVGPRTNWVHVLFEKN